MKLMTCLEYIEENDSSFTDLMDDMVWRDRKGDCREPLEALCKWSTDENVLLTDFLSFDAEAYFSGMWECGEWGLS